MKDEILRSVADDLEDLGKELGLSFKQSTANVAQYAAERAAHLSTIYGISGFDRAMAAERDAVLLYAGVEAANAGLKSDERMRGFVHGILSVMVRVAT